MRDAWIEDQDFKDPDTRQLLNRELPNQELTKIEKPAGIANPKDFRNEVVKFSLRSRAQNGGKNPGWTSYEKIRDVIEKRIFSQVEDLLPVISFGSKKDGDTRKEARRVCGADGGARLHRAPGSPASRVVHARRNKPAEAAARIAMHIVDRRLQSGEQESGEPPAFPAPREDVGEERRQEILRRPRHQGCTGGRRGQYPARRHG